MVEPPIHNQPYFHNSLILTFTNNNTAHYMAKETEEFYKTLDIINYIKYKLDFIIDCDDNSFVVLHPIDNSLNSSCDPNVEYRLVYHFTSNSLENAFLSAQNDNKDYFDLGNRSTSIGDMIVRCDDLTVYIVEGTGFREVPFTWFTFVNPKNHIQSI